MSASNRVGRWAKASLLLALAVAIAGLLLRNSGTAPVLGGMMLAFGEAALVGGLADWFAVRALFAHPFGIPFPHSALIPRNRRRIVAEIRGLVENEWLPRPMLVGRINTFDFVGDAILPFVGSHKESLQDLLRTVARNVLADIPPEQVAGFLARATGRALEAQEVQVFAARLLHRAREEGWLEPLLKAMLKRLEEWAGSVESHTVIFRHLDQAGSAYRNQGWFKSFTYQVAEAFGGVDLHHAASLLQNEIKRFAIEQGGEKGQLRRVIAEGMENIEHRLREDPAFLDRLRDFLVETSADGTLPALFGPVVASVHAEAMRELDTTDSPLLRWVLGRLDDWLRGVAEDEKAREQVSAWCRHLVVTLVERHHPIIGRLVEEQLNRLSDENLVELIENKVGEDLNWIRLNGTFVGGMIGLGLYLLFALLS
ncbi:MAG TPA: DUF445 domain-containing protein [Gemmataceae bacterium]|nr:DUF445 domain-containing protein [Gemmataceae bacterium]